MLRVWQTAYVSRELRHFFFFFFKVSSIVFVEKVSLSRYAERVSRDTASRENSRANASIGLLYSVSMIRVSPL